MSAIEEGTFAVEAITDGFEKPLPFFRPTLSGQ